MAGLVPAIPIRNARCSPKRDARAKPGHEETEDSAKIAEFYSALPPSFSLKNLTARSFTSSVASAFAPIF